MEALADILIIFLLVFMNAFFVATEFSIVKVRKSRIETLALEGDMVAKYAKRIVNDLNSYLSACQLGVTLASLGLGWIGEPAISKMLDPLFKYMGLSEASIHSISFILAFTIVTALHIVLGELVPKSLAIINAEKIALITAVPLVFFYRITYPIMWLFNHSTSLVLKIFKISQEEDHESAHTDSEIMLLVEDSYKHGLIDKTELMFVDNIFDFSEKVVREIMIPRTDMICFYKEDSFDKILDIAFQEELTRYPVCENSKDNVVGFVHIKDLFKQKVQGHSDSIEGIIRNVITVHESTSISILFKKLQKEKAQMAIVIDEYGGTAGLVTIEDILEEIVGEIRDEFDEEGELIEELKGGGYVLDGLALIEDVNELFNLDIDLEGVDTIGGWIFSQIESSPQVNQKIQYKEYEFIITECTKQRISKLEVKTIN